MYAQRQVRARKLLIQRLCQMQTTHSLKHIAQTYQNNRIMLNDGRSGTIVMLNQNHLSKPIVQFDDKSCLDLSTASRDLYIKAVL